MAEEINLIVNVDEGDSKKTVADVRKELKDTQDQADKTGKALGDGISGAETKTVSLKAQLKAMVAELGTLDSGSPRFKELTKLAGALKDKIGDINERVNALSSDTKRLDSLVRAGGAIAGGFQAANGAMALFGSNSKEVEKAIQNIIAVQGILNGVQQVGVFLTTKQNGASILDTTIKYAQAAATKVATASQWLLNIAMNANPISLIVIGVGLLVAAFVVFGKQIISFISNWDNLKVILLALINPIGAIILLYDKLFGAEAQAAAAREKAAEQKRKQDKEAKQQLAERLAEIKKLKEAEQEAFDQSQTASDLAIARMEAEGGSSRQLKIDKIQDIIDHTKFVLEQNGLLIQAYVDFYKKQALLSGQSEEEYIASLKRQGVDLLALQEQANASLQANRDAVFSAETDLLELKKGFREADATDAQAAKAERDRLAKEALDAETEILEEQREKHLQDIEDADALFLQRLEEEKRLNQEFRDAEEFADNAVRERDKELDEAAALEKQQRQDVAMKSAQQFAKASIDLAQTIFTLTNALGKQDEASKLKRAKRQFEINKALGIADATISTINGVVNALTEKSLLPTPLSTILKAANAVAVGAAGAANIAKIATTKFEGGVVSPDTALSSGGGLQSVGESTPNVNPIQAGSTFLNDEPQKVFVVESDITKTQKKVSVIEAAASFG